jgi:MFS family permease
MIAMEPQAGRAPVPAVSKRRSLALLVVAEMAGMSLWFAAAAVLPDMARETKLSSVAMALLTSSVQAGFVAGALALSISGLPDRVDPRRLFAVSAVAAALASAALLVVPVGGAAAIALRALAGALLAGVYPVGMKIAAGWGTKDRGFLIGLLVGALTVGAAAPHLAAFTGGTNWRAAVLVTSAVAAAGGVLILFAGLGPHHARAGRFDPRAIGLAWSEKRIRLAYAGYLGHMWELYAMWAWVGVAAASSYSVHLPTDRAEALAKLTAFLTIALGGVACLGAGWLADRIGKAEVTILAMAGSGTAALLTALAFGGPVWLVFLLIVVWGIAIIPDSAQFSALVADAAPADKAGSLLTFQTALGFGLTIATVQVTPAVAAAIGWPALLAIMALGPFAGIIAMIRLRRMGGSAPR